MSSNGTGPRRPSVKILAVRLGSLGDVIHALPAVANLKRGFPQAEVTWAIESRWAPLLEANRFIDQILELPISKWRKRPLAADTRAEFHEARRRLRAERFDLAVDFQGLLKSAMVTFFSRAEHVFGFHRAELREKLAATFYSECVQTRAEHVVDKNLHLASAAGARITGPEAETPLFPLPQGKAEASLPAGDFVLASPSAGWKSKQWPIAHYVVLANRIRRESGMPLVLDCAPGDTDAARAIVDAAEPGACVLHPSSLAGLIAATRLARAVVGVDSGPLHLAAALNKPGVAIYGPTDPARNGPFGRSFLVLRQPGTPASYQRDARIHPSMAAIGPEEVWPALKAKLALERTPVQP